MASVSANRHKIGPVFLRLAQSHLHMLIWPILSRFSRPARSKSPRISSFGPETLVRLVSEAGFEIIEAEIESQVEPDWENSGLAG